MTEPGAADMTVRESPRIDLAALRNLQRLLDATSPSSDDRFSTDRRDDDEIDAKASAELIRCADDADRDEGASSPTFLPSTKIMCLINYLPNRFRLRHHSVTLVEAGLKQPMIV
jgi:hypothetical protein